MSANIKYLHTKQNEMENGTKNSWWLVDLLQICSRAVCNKNYIHTTPLGVEDTKKSSEIISVQCTGSVFVVKFLSMCRLRRKSSLFAKNMVCDTRYNYSRWLKVGDNDSFWTTINTSKAENSFGFVLITTNKDLAY